MQELSRIQNLVKMAFVARDEVVKYVQTIVMVSQLQKISREMICHVVKGGAGL
jgi:hypothetical protein